MQPSPQTNSNLLVIAGYSGLFEVKFCESLRMNVPQPLYDTCSGMSNFQGDDFFLHYYLVFFVLQIVTNCSPKPGEFPWQRCTLKLTLNSFSRTPGPSFSLKICSAASCSQHMWIQEEFAELGSIWYIPSSLIQNVWMSPSKLEAKMTGNNLGQKCYKM